MLFWPTLNAICESIRAGRDFDLHCHSMTLAAGKEGMPKYHGPGVIRIGRERQFRFTLYSETYKAKPAKDDGVVGQLIPDESIYRLSAIDGEDHEWVCDKVFPDCVQPNKTMANAVVSGELIDLYSSQRIFGEGVSVQFPRRRLTLMACEAVDIPLNTRTHRESRIDGDENSQRGAMLDVAKVNVRDYEFCFHRQDDALEVRADGQAIVPALDKRIVESLQFVLARPFWWTILCEERSETVFIRLRSNPPSPHASKESHLPPIKSIDFFDRTDCVWILFAKYLDFILDRDPNSWHPLSMFVYSAFISHAAGFDTYRLALGVAIEGILESVFKDIVVVQDKQIEAINLLTVHLDAWRCSPPNEYEERLKQRIGGTLNSFRPIRAKDRLLKLLGMGVVTQQEIRAWEGLRHNAAHGHQPDTSPSQAEIDEVDTVTTLMHKLVFQAIGYSGKYTDYGTHGWPTRDFTAVTPTN
jgi:hypothetical protein